MRVSIILLAATIAAAASTSPASATVRIAADPGGQIGPYLDKLQSLRKSGQNVIIDGSCLSACTMVLGVIPPWPVVTARARLGFHSAWRPDQSGRQTVSQEGTELLMTLSAAGSGLDFPPRRPLPQLIYLTGGELATMYPRCNENVTTGADMRTRRERALGGFHPNKAQGASASATARIQ